MSDRVLVKLRERFAQPPPVLFPRPCGNADGRYPLELTTLNRRLRRWLDACDVRDAQGRSVRITSHQFRHTLGTRLRTAALFVSPVECGGQRQRRGYSFRPIE